MLTQPSRNHARVKREVLAALDSEIAKLKTVINSTDIAIAALDVRKSQLEELHRIRFERLALFDEDEGPGYRLAEPSATWGMSR